MSHPDKASTVHGWCTWIQKWIRTIPLEVGFSRWSEFRSEYPFLSGFSTLSIKQHTNLCIFLYCFYKNLNFWVNNHNHWLGFLKIQKFKPDFKIIQLCFQKKKKHQNTSVKNTKISNIVPGSLIPKVKITFFKRYTETEACLFLKMASSLLYTMLNWIFTYNHKTRELWRSNVVRMYIPDYENVNKLRGLGCRW